MMCKKSEFKQKIKDAMWNWLDKLADRIDRHYAKLGIKKRKVKRKNLK